MEKKLLKSEMDTNETVKDSGDTGKMVESRTNCLGHINKGVSERGDTKTVFVDRRMNERKSNNKNERKHLDKISDEVRTITEVDKSLKTANTANEARLKNIKSLARKQESVTKSTRKYGTLNTTKGKDITNRFNEKEFKSFPENNEHKPTVTSGESTIVNKDMKLPRKQDLDTNVTRIHDDITKGTPKKSDAKDMIFSDYNERGQNIKVNVYDKSVKLPRKQELARDVSTRKSDSQNMIRKVRDITENSAGKESIANSPGKTKCRQNIIVNDKGNKMHNKQELITNVSKRKSSPQNVIKNASQKNTSQKNITKKSVGEESTKNTQRNNEIDQNCTVNVSDKETKICSKQERVNKLLSRKYDVENVNKEKQHKTSFDTQETNHNTETNNSSLNNKHERNITVNINNRDINVMTAKSIQNRNEKGTVRILPVNKKSGQNITGKGEETRIPNDSDVHYKKSEGDEKKNAGNKNIIKAMNAQNIRNVKIGKFQRGNAKSQNAEVNIINDGLSRSSPQSINGVQEVVAEIKTKISNQTGIFKPDKAEKSPSQLNKRTARNDKDKVHQSVTYLDQKEKRTPLKVNLAAAFKPKISPERKMKMIPSKTSVKVVKRKEIGRGRRKNQYPMPSPGPRFPYKKVAKLAPSSINNHTKLYYEAWVDTTLAAISKSSEIDKLLLEKQKLQKALAAKTSSAELAYENFTDERFTGRIKVRQRQRNELS